MRGANQEVPMFRSLTALAAFTLVFSLAAPSLAQAPVPIPGARAHIVLPPGCALEGLGTVVCGTERVSIGGSALGFDELRAAHVAAGHEVQDVPVRPRSFFVTLAAHRLLMVRDAEDERVLLLGTTTRPGAEAGQSFGRVFLALETERRGSVVTGYASLDRSRIPHATVYWSEGTLAFTSGAIEVGAERLGTAGFFRENSGTTMTALCDNGSITSQVRARLLVRHQRVINEVVSVCEEAFVVQTPMRRVLAAQFGYILRDGRAYSLTMTYSLEDGERETDCIEGFEHFALPALAALLGVGDE